MTNNDHAYIIHPAYPSDTQLRVPGVSSMERHKSMSNVVVLKSDAGDWLINFDNVLAIQKVVRG